MVAQFLVWLMPPDHVVLISDTGEPSLGTLHLLLSTLCVPTFIASSSDCILLIVSLSAN